ncbi:MAG: glycosyltransferase [Xenococcus sp. (in: cyanobacteria)]
MKVLHLLGTSSYLPWVTGGSIISCHRLCQNLQRLGVEVLVVIHQHPSGREPLGNHVYETVPVQVLPSIADAVERLALYSRTTVDVTGFDRVLASYRPDIVHFHDFTASAGITHMQLAKQAGSKIVLTYHTPGNSCSQHGLLYQGKTVCDGEIKLQRCSECRLAVAGLHPIFSKLAALWSPSWLDVKDSNLISRLLTTRKMTEIFQESWLKMLDLVDALHVHAQWVQKLVELNGASSDKVHFFRTGAPDVIRHNSRQPLEDGILKLVFVGRSTHIKGIHVLIEAIRLLPTDLPIKVTFCCSDINWQQKEYSQKIRQQLEADFRFDVQYNIPNSQLLNLLANYDFCVVPSIWLETGPLTVLEAFAAGIPIIGSRLGGIAELVRDGLDGLLFEPGNSSELASIIQRLLTETELISMLKANVQHPRTMSNLAYDTLTMYESLVPMLKTN